MSTATYGGDEVSALVFDIGSSTSKVGYAGEDTPKAVFPSYVGYYPQAADESDAMDVDGGAGMVGKSEKSGKKYVGETELYAWRAGLEVKNPMVDGIVDDWDTYTSLWSHSFKSLRVDPTEHPLLLAEPSWNPRPVREKLIELAFEEFGVPCFYLARSAVLSAFAAGRSTALVLDSGGSMTSAVPVVDGFVLKKAIQKQPYAGRHMSSQALSYLASMGMDVTPQYLVKRKVAVDAAMPAVWEKRDERMHGATTQSWHDMALERAVDEFKETVCHVSEFQFDEKTLSQRPVKNYEFPDGYNNAFGIERFKITESLFNNRFLLRDPQAAAGAKLDSNQAQDTAQPTIMTDPSQAPPPSASSPTNPPQQQSTATPAIPRASLRSLIPPTFTPASITSLIQQSIHACDPDLRTQLYPNVVLTGANTLLPGFADRVHYELLTSAPGFKTKIQAAGQTTERRFSPWIGGSILASLGTFHQLWVSKTEYDEEGASSIEKRLH